MNCFQKIYRVITIILYVFIMQAATSHCMHKKIHFDWIIHDARLAIILIPTKLVGINL